MPWEPAESVEPGELVGRRLFDRSGRPKGADGRPELRVQDFLEARDDADLSLDRLGRPNPSRETLAAITRLADIAGSSRTPPHLFEGWAAILVSRLRFPGWTATIVPDPISGGDRQAENKWHANLSRDGFRQKAQAYALAAALQQTFERKGSYVLASRP